MFLKPLSLSLSSGLLLDVKTGHRFLEAKLDVASQIANQFKIWWRCGKVTNGRDFKDWKVIEGFSIDNIISGVEVPMADLSFEICEISLVTGWWKELIALLVLWAAMSKIAA